MASLDVEFRHGNGMFDSAGTFLIHGVNLAPVLISTSADGPIMKLNVGLVAIGVP